MHSCTVKPGLVNSLGSWDLSHEQCRIRRSIHLRRSCVKAPVAILCNHNRSLMCRRVCNDTHAGPGTKSRLHRWEEGQQLMRFRHVLQVGKLLTALRCQLAYCCHWPPAVSYICRHAAKRTATVSSYTRVSSRVLGKRTGKA